MIQGEAARRARVLLVMAPGLLVVSFLTSAALAPPGREWTLPGLLIGAIGVGALAFGAMDAGPTGRREGIGVGLGVFGAGVGVILAYTLTDLPPEATLLAGITFEELENALVGAGGLTVAACLVAAAAVGLRDAATGPRRDR